MPFSIRINEPVNIFTNPRDIHAKTTHKHGRIIDGSDIEGQLELNKQTIHLPNTLRRKLQREGRGKGKGRRRGNRQSKYFITHEKKKIKDVRLFAVEGKYYFYFSQNGEMDASTNKHGKSDISTTNSILRNGNLTHPPPTQILMRLMTTLRDQTMINF